MEKMAKRGFFTIAFGKHYQKIAYNLLLTARYNKLKYPFAIITDCSNKYTKAFNLEIVRKPLAEGFLNKLYIDEYAPFEESMFIDADVLLFKDISSLLDLLAESKVTYVAFGNNFDKTYDKPLYFSLDKVKSIGVTYCPSFNGAIYFYKKSNIYKKIFADARFLFIEKGDYDFLYPEGDESYIALAMAKNGARCYENVSPIYSGNYYQNIKIFDLREHKLISNDYKEYSVYHVSTKQTHGTIYKKQVGMLKYRNSPIVLFYKLGIFSLISRLFNLLKRIAGIRYE